MKTTLHIVVLCVALIAILLLADAWRSARKDASQLNATLATQNTAMQQSAEREKQRDAQLSSALAAITTQKRAVRTPQEAAKAIPTVLPQLPLPVSIQIPNLSQPPKSGPPTPGDVPAATIAIPQPDLVPLYDDLQDCRAATLQTDTLKKDLVDEQTRATTLSHERDSAIAAAHGGTFWIRLKRSAKWFAIGVAAGAAATAVAHH